MNISSVFRRLAPALALTAMFGLAACATPSRPEAMSLTSVDGLTAQSGQVGYRAVRSVTASGGSETNPLWASQVSNEALESAVRQSLQAAGYMGEEGQPITVQVSLMGLDQPGMGIDFNVTSRVRYVVRQGDREIYNQTIEAVGRGTMGDAFVGTERLRIANEKSIQENIRLFLVDFRSRVR